jgi:glycerol uptake facilitator-like aquaporin
MERNLARAYVVELVGSFVFVFLAAGAVCVNAMTTPAGPLPATTALTSHQPGLIGVALAQGLTYAVLLAMTLPVSGGYLNPAVSIMLWVFNRLDSVRAAWFVGAQLLGAALAGLCLRFTFDLREVLVPAQFGTPHLNPIVYPILSRGVLIAGTGIELILTFFLVLAIFGITPRPRLAGLAGGAALTAGVLFAFPLTGAATNPGRWFGTVFWELLLTESGQRGPLADVFVYVAGPILGALAAGLFCFKLLGPTQTRRAAMTARDERIKPASTHVKTKK